MLMSCLKKSGLYCWQCQEALLFRLRGLGETTSKGKSRPMGRSGVGGRGESLREGKGRVEGHSFYTSRSYIRPCIQKTEQPNMVHLMHGWVVTVLLYRPSGLLLHAFVPTKG